MARQVRQVCVRLALMSRLLSLPDSRVSVTDVTGVTTVNVYDIINLTKRYPGQTIPANDNLTFTVEMGEIFGLLGANGAGKTTLVKQMANLLTPSSGCVRLFGRLLTDDPLYAPSQIGYMSQGVHALNILTVAETLYFTAHLRGLSRRDARAERDALLEKFDLGSLRHHPANQISGGQKRLVLLATAMTARPPVLILDEPTNDLDPQYRRFVWDEITALNQKHGTTVILVTHNVLEAEQVIQRVGIMRSGQLIALGRPGQLKGTLNQQLRLKIIFSPGQPPTLPDDAAPREIAPGHWRLLIDQEKAPAYLAAITAAESIEDFQLGTATLEDLYLSLAADDTATTPVRN